MSKISIAIPIYPMLNARFFLTRCLDSLIDQTFEDFDVVITDNSDDDNLEKIVRTYGMKIDYSKNPRKGACANTNEALKRSRGDLIHILHMDDYFNSKHVLKTIVGAFKGNWMVSACDNNPNPRWTDDITTGNNKLGGPSVLTIKNENVQLFDESLVWLFDCDYYKRMFDKYGKPTINKKVCITIGVHDGQMTNLIPMERKILEVKNARMKQE